MNQVAGKVHDRHRLTHIETEDFTPFTQHEGL